MLRSTSSSQTNSNLKPSWVCPAITAPAVCRPRRRRRHRRTTRTALAIRCWPGYNFPPDWRRSAVWPVWLAVECSRSSSSSQRCNYLRFQVKANSNNCSSSSSIKWAANCLRTNTTCRFSCQRVELRSGIRKRMDWPALLTRSSIRWPRSRRTTPRRWD